MTSSRPTTWFCGCVESSKLKLSRYLPDLFRTRSSLCFQIDEEWAIQNRDVQSRFDVRKRHQNLLKRRPPIILCFKTRISPPSSTNCWRIPVSKYLIAVGLGNHAVQDQIWILMDLRVLIVLRLVKRFDHFMLIVIAYVRGIMFRECLDRNQPLVWQDVTLE